MAYRQRPEVRLLGRRRPTDTDQELLEALRDFPFNSVLRRSRRWVAAALKLPLLGLLARLAGGRPGGFWASAIPNAELWSGPN